MTAIPPAASTFERLERMTNDLGALVEELGIVVAGGVEAEVLREVAIEVGVDWTTDPTTVLRDIAAVVQRERDINRELRRHVRADARERIAIPPGFVACRSCRDSVQTVHLVALDEHGRNGGRPTVCGLTRFDERDPDSDEVVRPADLPGWSMGGGGIFGPATVQRACPKCWQEVDR